MDTYDSINSEDKKDISNNGIEIKKNELTIDELDEIVEESKKDEQKKAKTKEKAPLKEQLLQDLSEEEVKELFQAKQMLEEQKKLIEEKSSLLTEYEDLLKRKQAEFENYKKRAQKEVEDFKKYANAEMVLDILNTIDDFERAIESTKSSKDFDALLEGIHLVEKQLKTVLEIKYAVKMIEAVGKEFDPTIHDAVMMEESEEYDEDIVIEDFQKGYIMYDRIIRPSKVKVAKAVSPEINEKNADENNERNTSEKGE